MKKQKHELVLKLRKIRSFFCEKHLQVFVFFPGGETISGEPQNCREIDHRDDICNFLLTCNFCYVKH